VYVLAVFLTIMVGATAFDRRDTTAMLVLAEHRHVQIEVWVKER
jgi:hypothetical protein